FGFRPHRYVSADRGSALRLGANRYRAIGRLLRSCEVPALNTQATNTPSNEHFKQQLAASFLLGSVDHLGYPCK
ncbi:MAG: hypothetical protein PUK40_04435, partial [Actinomycetaceae bacterium]|nr:hypothetical protein [Actinomycetaceae bacterium]